MSRLLSTVWRNSAGEETAWAILIDRLWIVIDNIRQYGLWVLLVLAIPAAVVLALWLRERWLYRRLNRLLDIALSGNILGETFNESRYSQLETKLYRYLKSSSLTRRQIEAERAQIAEMVSDISHQTKTPITNILLYTQLLQESELGEESRELAMQIMEQGDRLRFLVEALVKASRLENGLVVVKPDRYLLEEFCAQLGSDIASSAAEKGIIVEWKIPEGIICRYDPKWTGEAIRNILDNAVKYTPCGGRIKITAQLYELFCRIDITDSGIGITEEEQPHVFERFYRSPRVAQQEGVGIGLYLSRRIISDQGGYIKLSTGGKGTTFSVFLPR